jgi:hypothetical protein
VFFLFAEGMSKQIERLSTPFANLSLSLSLLLRILTFIYSNNDSNLGIDDMYFASESVESIANHIMALYGAKIFAYTKNDNGLDINLERETEEGAVYIHTSRPGVSQLYGPQHEKRYFL